MLDDELRGTLVFVHPELPYDPLNKQNQVGFICEANIRLDDIYVDFKDKIGLYSSDALMVLLPVEQIHQNLAELNYLTDFDDLKKLTTIDLFTRYGSKAKQFEAMQIARDHPNIQHLCLDTLQNQIALQNSQSYER